MLLLSEKIDTLMAQDQPDPRMQIELNATQTLITVLCDEENGHLATKALELGVSRISQNDFNVAECRIAQATYRRTLSEFQS